MTTKQNSISPFAIGFLFAIGSAALFAIRPIFVKMVYMENVDSTTLLALRMIFSAPLYFLLLCYFLRDSERRAKLNLNNILKMSAIGLLGYYGASLFDLLGLQYITAQLARLILFIYPTFVVIFGALLFSERITMKTVISLLITYAGISIIFTYDLNSFGSNVITGGILVLISAILFAFYLLFSKSLIKDVGSRLFTCVALLSASAGILCHFAITHNPSELLVSNRALLLVFTIAIFCTVIPTFLTTAAIARIGPDKTSIIATIGPAFTSVFAVFILGEAFTVYHAIGIVLTITGVSVLGINRAIKQPRA